MSVFRQQQEEDDDFLLHSDSDDSENEDSRDEEGSRDGTLNPVTKLGSYSEEKLHQILSELDGMERPLSEHTMQVLNVFVLKENPLFACVVVVCLRR